MNEIYTNGTGYHQDHVKELACSVFWFDLSFLPRILFHKKI